MTRLFKIFGNVASFLETNPSNKGARWPDLDDHFMTRAQQRGTVSRFSSASAISYKCQTNFQKKREKGRKKVCKSFYCIVKFFLYNQKQKQLEIICVYGICKVGCKHCPNKDSRSFSFVTYCSLSWELVGRTGTCCKEVISGVVSGSLFLTSWFFDIAFSLLP